MILFFDFLNTFEIRYVFVKTYYQFEHSRIQMVFRALGQNNGFLNYERRRSKLSDSRLVESFLTYTQSVLLCTEKNRIRRAVNGEREMYIQGWPTITEKYLVK